MIRIRHYRVILKNQYFGNNYTLVLNMLLGAEPNELPPTFTKEHLMLIDMRGLPIREKISLPHRVVSCN